MCLRYDLNSITTTVIWILGFDQRKTHYLYLVILTELSRVVTKATFETGFPVTSMMLCQVTFAVKYNLLVGYFI
jgi:hypothetical protein